jgi:spore germination protein GerM
MSRRRQPPPSRAPTCLLSLFLLALLVGAAYVWQFRPDLMDRLRPHRVRPTVRVEQPGQTTATPTPTHGTTARLYFRRIVGGKERLEAVTRPLPPGLGTAQAALHELLFGDVPPGCERPLPKGTKLLRVHVEDGVATADFSRELTANFQGGSDHEGATVYAIVNTLASLPTVKQTRILVAGQPLDTLGGHLDVSGPLAEDDELVVR